MRRVQYRELVADYFSRGGTLHKLPTPEPSSSSDLDYLSECNFRVYPAPHGEGQQKYVYQGQVTTPVRKPKATWVRPELLVDVQYRSITPDGRLRHVQCHCYRSDFRRD